MLNIKDGEAHRLASEIAARTGKSLTRVVIDALRAEAARGMAPRSLDRAKIKAIQQRVRAKLRAGSDLSGVDLYDDRGLPK